MKHLTEPVNKLNGRYNQDTFGTWWYLISEKTGSRTKAIVKKCMGCNEVYLTLKQRFNNPVSPNAGKFCSRDCASRTTGGHRGRKGELSHRWKGGRRESGKGYVELFCPEHPSLKGTKRKYVREHRLVMETKLGRILDKWEEVHHLNGIRNDNRIENLELWVRSHPAGVRFEQAIKHCPSCTCNNHFINVN